ncbi:sulfotransferase [Candidatus Pelagibacter sp.]|nr:sulfotransferase [Candidatus Pelagibacter sp.]
MDLEEKIRILNNHLKARNFNKVIEGAHIILKKIPKNDYILNMIGMAYQGRTQFRKSINFFKEALKQNSQNIAAMNNYANSLKAVGEFELAKELYEKILKINPGYINAYNNYANLKTLYNDYEGAIELYKQAIRLLQESKDIPVSASLGFMFALATAYQSSNKINEAKDLIEEIFSIDSSHAGANKLLSSILKYSDEDKNSIDHLIQMEKINNDKKLTEDKKIDISFSLGKAHEDLKNFDKAYKFFEKANELRYKKFGSNLDNEKKLFKNIIKTFQEIRFDISNREKPSKKIIFICGMPRSGTTLTEQIIASHNDVYGAGELVYLQQVLKKNFYNDLKFDKQKIIDNQSLPKNIIFTEYLEHFSIYNLNENIITDKAPQNFRWIGFIKLFFPNSKIIHCYRSPRDNCLSLFKNSFASSMMDWSNNPEDIAKYYNLYSELMEFWKSKIPNFIHDVSYESLVQDKEKEIKKILDFCELEWDEKCLRPDKNSKTPIKTVSVSQARQPIYKSSLNSNQNYDKYLEKMFSILK